MEELRILAINPGSTSTKIAVFSGANPVFVRTISHSTEELSKYDKITDQYNFRKEIIYKQLEEAGIEMDSIRAVVGRGGLTKPIPSGVYEVNETMKNDMVNSPMGEHASNLVVLLPTTLRKACPMRGHLLPILWLWMNWNPMPVFRVTRSFSVNPSFMRSTRKQQPVSMPNRSCGDMKTST